MMEIWRLWKKEMEKRLAQLGNKTIPLGLECGIQMKLALRELGSRRSLLSLVSKWTFILSILGTIKQWNDVICIVNDYYNFYVELANGVARMEGGITHRRLLLYSREEFTLVSAIGKSTEWLGLWWGQWG